MTNINERANKVLMDAMRDLAAMDQQIERDRIDADPKANKLTRLMAEGKPSTYKYWKAGRDGRGWQVRYCYTCWRNYAGYFLSFRELIPPAGSKANFSVKRDKWAARKVRKRAAALALRRRDAFVEKHRETP